MIPDAPPNRKNSTNAEAHGKQSLQLRGCFHVTLALTINENLPNTLCTKRSVSCV